MVEAARACGHAQRQHRKHADSLLPVEQPRTHTVGEHHREALPTGATISPLVLGNPAAAKALAATCALAAAARLSRPPTACQIRCPS